MLVVLMSGPGSPAVIGVARKTVKKVAEQTPVEAKKTDVQQPQQAGQCNCGCG